MRAAMGVERGDVKGIAGLRKMCSDAEVVRAAMVLGEARRKAVGKFGVKRAATLWADPAGVEMATSTVVADYKDAIFNMLLCRNDAFDLCCGIGGDAIALAPTLDLTVVDSDPVRAWMAARNSGCPAICADATTIDCSAAAVHIDPARRSEGRRLWRSEDLLPSLAEVRSIMDRTTLGGAVKLGPGADLEAIEGAFPNGMVDVISERGRLVQTVVWIGDLVLANPGSRQATLVMGQPGAQLPENSWVTIQEPVSIEAPPATEDSRARRYVYEPDDSVERAGLLGALCAKLGAPMLHPRVGLLTSDVLLRSPWVSGFEVVEEMVWNEKRVKGVLEAHGAGIVEVKTRGGVVETDAMQGRLRGKGDAPMVVFVVRVGREVRAIIARRVLATC